MASNGSPHASGYRAAIGLVVGVLVAGIAVPFIYGVRESSVAAGPGAAAPPLAGGSARSDVDELLAGAGAGGDDVEVGEAGVDGAGVDGAGGSGRTAEGDVPGNGGGARTAAGDPVAAARSVAGDRTASEVGVTPSEVRVGVLLLDLGVASDVGFGTGTEGLDPKAQRRWYQAFFDHINQAGGVNGRRLTPLYSTYSPIDQDSQRASCLAHTEDQKVFAAMENTGGYRGPVVLCYTAEHLTPFLSVPHRHNADVTRRSGNRLLAYGMTTSRIGRNAVHELQALGKLKGQKIGVLETARGGNRESTDAGVITGLRELGYDAAERFVFSDVPSTASSQIPVAVQQMRSAQVTMLFIHSDVLTSTQFVQQADAQLYRPLYVTDDFYGVGSDFGAMNMPASFAGSLGLTAEGDAEHNDPKRPELGPDRRCREIQEKATGERFPLDSNESALVRLSCGVVQLLEVGLRGAGVNPTRDSFSAAIQRTGAVNPPRMAPGFFAPGRQDAASQLRAQTWDARCKCWMVLNEFHEARF